MRQVEVERPGGGQEVINVLRAGSVFGEGVFIAGARRRQATVRCWRSTLQRGREGGRERGRTAYIFGAYGSIAHCEVVDLQIYVRAQLYHP